MTRYKIKKTDASIHWITEKVVPNSFRHLSLSQLCVFMSKIICGLMWKDKILFFLLLITKMILVPALALLKF